jgi:hypothetical protein
MKVKIRSGNLQTTIERTTMPSEKETAEAMMEYADKMDTEVFELSDLTMVTSGRGRNAKTFYVSTKALMALLKDKVSIQSKGA